MLCNEAFKLIDERLQRQTILGRKEDLKRSKRQIWQCQYVFEQEQPTLEAHGAP